MSFRKLKDSFPEKEVFFNSEESKEFLDLYNESKRKDLIPKEVYVPKKRFSPSSIRCKRMSWFKLRGVVPEVNMNPDVSLEFIAGIGTHCHEVIQQDLIRYLGDDWVEVEDYLKENPPEFEYSLEKHGLETRVRLEDPPIGFACDGIIKRNGKYYLLEIKTSEDRSMRRLVGPKPEHIDQITCYCTLLGIDDALVLYQDRSYGRVKCFTKHVTQAEKDRILNTFKEVQEAVKRNIPPEKLPPGDKWCSPSYCGYYKTCKQWG